MSSYTDIFGGSTVQPSEVSYAEYTIAADLTLNWPTAFQDSPNVMARIIDVNATAAALAVFLPDATQVSPGQDVLFTNIGANSFVVQDFEQFNIVNVNPGTSWYLYLIDNTTPRGIWRTVPFAGGIAAVTSVDAVSLTPDITVVGGPIVNVGTFTFNLGADLAAIVAVAAPGYLVKTGAGAWTTRNIVQGINILVTNPDGVAGNTVIALSPNLVNINSAAIGNFNITANTISTTNPGGNIILTPNGAGEVQSNSNVDILSGKVLRFYNPLDTNFAGFASPAGVTGTVWNLPIGDGAAGQVLQTDGALQLGWVNVVTFGGPSTDKAIARFNGVGGSIQNSGVIISDLNAITGALSITVQNLQIGAGTVPANTIQSINADGAILFEPNGTGETQSVKNFGIQNANLAKFYNVGNTQFVALKAGVLAGNTTWTLPLADATAAGQAIVSDAAGNLSFSGLGLAKAWVKFNAAGAIQNQFNVANVAHPGVGTYTITFTNPMPNANYVPVCIGINNSSVAQPGAFLVGSFQVQMFLSSTGAPQDSGGMVVVFGT